MDINETWATKIAQEVAPEEVDLAPLMAQAFINGGQERDDLFRKAKGGILGAFGAGDVSALIPWILQSIAGAATAIYALLSSGVLEKLLWAIKDLLSIRDSLARKKQSESLPDNPYAPLKRVVSAISKGLEAAKIPEDQRDLITYRVLRLLLEDPQGAAVFVKNVEAKR